MAKKDNVMLMMAFRETVFKFDLVSFYNTDDKLVLCDLEYIKDKYVYVFTTDPSDSSKYRLYNEYLGVGDGNFKISLLAKNRGKDKREFSAELKKNLVVPAVVNGQKLELFACLSQIQLPWKRIEEISVNPAARCYDLRATKGGLCWIPDCVERNITELSGVRDSRIADPGNSVVMVGLYDYLREAERRAIQFCKKLDTYLQSRFDCDQLGKSDPMQERLQMKKYGAGLVLNLVKSNHPHVKKFRVALKNGGRDLEDFIRKENEKEIRIRQDAEKAACSLARWIDDPDDVFEEVLDDYTADPDNQDLWDCIQEYYCGLLNRFNELSITRKYISDKWKNKNSWMRRYMLNEDAFQSYRKVTGAVAEFLSVISSEACRGLSVDVAKGITEGIYRVFLKGVVFKVVTEEFKSGTKVFLKKLSSAPDINRLKKLYIADSTDTLKKLGKIGESDIVKSLQLGIECVNMVLSISELFDKSKEGGIELFAGGINLAGSSIDLFVSVAERFDQLGDAIGKPRLALFGVVSSAIDCGLAIYESTEEYGDKDYDAMASKIAIAVGAATAAVGYGMVFSSAVISVMSSGVSLMAAAQSVIFAGAGATATGVGSPVGAALIFAGTALVAAGTIAYFFSNDSETETWIKKSPWGVDEEWNFEVENEYSKRLDSLHSLLYSFKADVLYDRFKRRAVVQMKSVFFQAETKIVIQEMFVYDGGTAERVITAPVVVDEEIGIIPIDVEVVTVVETGVTVSLPHKSKLNSTDKIEARIYVDLFGNGKVMLPERNKPVTCKAHIFQ